MMKKTPIAVIVCLVVLSVSNYVHAQQGQKVTVSEILGERKEYYFDDNKPNELPPGFQSAFTGKGEPGLWVVKKIEHAPSADNVVVQTKLDTMDYRFPLLILDGVSYKDIMVSVRFRAVSGKTDQAGGLVFRYKDNNNYYVLRANALEDNVRLYTVDGGSVGLWTKADSYTFFDDLVVQEMK